MNSLPENGWGGATGSQRNRGGVRDGGSQRRRGRGGNGSGGGGGGSSAHSSAGRAAGSGSGMAAYATYPSPVERAVVCKLRLMQKGTCAGDRKTRTLVLNRFLNRRPVADATATATASTGAAAQSNSDDTVVSELPTRLYRFDACVGQKALAAATARTAAPTPSSGSATGSNTSSSSSSAANLVVEGGGLVAPALCLAAGGVRSKGVCARE